MKNNFYIVLMAGGSGTRLWPISRTNLPKQFHKFSSKKSLLQETYERIKNLVPRENIYVSVVSAIAKTCRHQLPEIPYKNFIIEPALKNTAPAIGLVATKLFRFNPNASCVILCSDHTIEKVERFQKTIFDSVRFLENNPDFLLTIGIKPKDANTGYGYIKIGNKFPKKKFFKVEKFVEKPDLKTAQTYLATGKYFWNAGYFIFKAAKVLEMFEKLSPEIDKNLRKILEARGTPDEENIINRLYENMPKVPFDTAIAEKYDKVAVIPTDIGWSDVGSWSSLYELLSHKKGQNIVSEGHHIGVGDKNCLVYAQDKLLATVGLEDIIIVDTPDVTLVCNKKRSQEIKSLIEKLKIKGKDKYL